MRCAPIGEAMALKILLNASWAASHQALQRSVHASKVALASRVTSWKFRMRRLGVAAGANDVGKAVLYEDFGGAYTAPKNRFRY